MRTDPARQGDPRGRANEAESVKNAAKDAGIPKDSGVFVSVRVISREGQGLFRMESAGVVFTAKSPLGLEPGEELLARFSKDGRLLETKPLGAEARAGKGPPLPAAGGLTNAQLSAQAGRLADPAMAGLFRTLKALGLPFEPKLIAKIRAAAKGSAEGEEMAALFASKGIEPTEEAVAALGAALYGEGRAGSGPGGDPSRDRGGSAGGKGANSGNGESPGSDISSEGSAEPALELGESSERGNLLSLLNHRAAGRGKWVLIPFRFRAAQVEFSGSMNVKLGSSAGAPEKFIVDARDGDGGRWVFDLSRPGSVRLSGKNGSAGFGEEGLAELAAGLREAGSSLAGVAVEAGPSAFGEEELPAGVDILA